MFNENLVESSPALRRRRHWPTVAAFVIQLAVAGALLVVPLFYVGVLPLRYRDQLPTPLTTAPLIHDAVVRPASGGGGGGDYRNKPAVTLLAWDTSHTSRIPQRHPYESGGDPLPLPGGDHGLPTGLGRGPGTGGDPRPEEAKKPIRRSYLDEGLLLSKTVPEYPIIAKRTGVQGDVKLHAIIARDGTIQSLNLISGHPLLVTAAMDAVRQWRYRPYLLNGEAVEVETYITVTFRRTN